MAKTYYHPAALPSLRLEGLALRSEGLALPVFRRRYHTRCNRRNISLRVEQVRGLFTSQCRGYQKQLFGSLNELSLLVVFVLDSESLFR